MQALTSLAASTAKSAKGWSDSTTVWTTTWPLWPLQVSDLHGVFPCVSLWLSLAVSR